MTILQLSIAFALTLAVYPRAENGTALATPRPAGVSFLGTPSTRMPTSAAHKFHVSTGRVAIEGNVLVNQTRFFADDLTAALRSFGKDDHFTLDTSPRSDSLFAAYFNAHFVIEVDEVRLTGHIVASGEDREGSEEVWWYAVQFDAESEINGIVMHNTLLVEQFDDQKNVVKVQKFPSTHSSSYYFDSDETRITITF